MTFSRSSHPALYRVCQFFVALKAGLPGWAGGMRGKLLDENAGLVSSILKTPSQQELFARMSTNDQRHALAVATTLRQAGYDEPALMQAALLHDAGKSLGQPIIYRTFIVLGQAFWPAFLQRLSRLDQPASSQLSPAKYSSSLTQINRWRRPFAIHAHHPAIGAAWAKTAGCEPLAVRLIARHEAGPELDESDEGMKKLLEALQWADDLN